MSFPALLYTAAAIGFFIMMMNRPAVDVTNATNSSSATKVTQTGDAASDSTQVAVSSAWDDKKPADGDTSSGDQENDSTGEQQSADATNTNGDQASSETASQQSTDVSASGEATTADGEQADTSTRTAGNAATTQTSNAAAGDNDSVTMARQADSTAKPDYTRERRLGNRVRGSLKTGELLFLHGSGRNFMSIQTDAGQGRGGAVILHGKDVHPNWEDTINPLRTGLAQTGWTTLSLQMPVMGKDAAYQDYAPIFPEAGQRIKAGIQHLKDQGISPIVLIGHSLGAQMAMHWLNDSGDSDVGAFVGLGMGATDADATPLLPLDQIQIPVFDAYGDGASAAVTEMAPERWELMKTSGNPQSEQRVLPGADDNFTGKGDEVTGLVSNWLNGLKFE